MHLRTRRASRVTMSRASQRVAASRFVATRFVTSRAFALLTALGVGSQAFAIDLPIPIEEPKRDKEVEFHSEVAPLLRKSCLACHNEKVAEAGLNMETLAKMLKGGDNGPALVVGDAAKSLILARATGSEEPLMPPEDNSAGAKPLTPQELGLISLWIKQGAKVGEAKLVNAPAWQKIPQGFQPIYAIDVSPDGHYVASSRGSSVVVNEVAGFAEIGKLVDSSLPETAGGAAADIDLVQAIAFSPDGSQIATGGYRGVKLWDKVNAPIDLGAKPWAAGAAGPVALSADSPLRAVAQSDGSIKLFEGDAAEPKASLSGHTLPVVGMAMKNSGESLVSVDGGGNIIVWNTQSGQAVARTELGRSVDALAAPAGLSHVAVLDGGGAVHMFQIVAGEPVMIQPHLADKTAALQDVTAIAWADAATPSLVVATEAGPVQILDANTAAALKTIDAGAPVDALAVAKGSNQIVTAARDGALKVWDSASGELKRTLRGDPRRVRWNDRAARDVARQDGLLKRLAAISEEMKKRKENEEMAVVKATETRDKSAEGVKEPTAKFAAAMTDLTGTETKIADLTKQIGDLKPKVDETSAKLKAAEEEANKAAEAAKTAQAPPAAPAPAAPAPDAPKPLAVQVAEKLAEVKAQLAAAEAELKKLIATAEAELKTLNDGLEAKKKAFTDAKTAKENADAELVKHQQALDAGIEARDRLLALIAEHDARVAAETRQSKSLARLGQRYQRELGENAYPAVAVGCSPAGDRLATLHRDGSVRVYQGEETFARTVLDSGVLPAPGTRRPQFAFPDANSVVLLGDGGKRLGWELKPRWVLARTIGNPLDTTQESPITDRVTAIDYHPDGKLIAVGSGPPSRTGQLLLFSTEDGKLVKQFEGVHSDTVLAVRFSPDGRFLASSAADKIVRILDPQKGIALKSLEGHTHHVLSLAWNDNAATLASASADQTVKVWDAENGTQARTIPGIGKEATSIRFVGTTGQVLTSGADGNVRLHETGDGKAVRSFAAAGDFLFSVAVTPDGGVVFTGGQEGILRAWTVADGKVVAEIKPQS